MSLPVLWATISDRAVSNQKSSVHRFVVWLWVLCICEQGELYRSLMRVALKQQDEIKLIILETVASEEESVLQCAASFQFIGLSL